MKELSEKLQELGLSGREAEIYLALLIKNELSASEVAKITSVSRTKSYELLQNLVKKNVCNERYKNGIKVFSSIEPTIGIRNMLAVYEEELDKKKKLAEEFKKELIELHKIKEENNDPLDYIEVLSDKGQIRDRWLNIQRNTKKELLVFTKQPYVVPLEENIKEEAELMESKKIIGKSIYEFKNVDTIEGKNNLIQLIEVFQKFGEEARIVKELPMKLVICDETVSILVLNDRVTLTPTSTTTIVIDHPSLAIALKNVFESYWQLGLTVEEFKKMNIG